MRKWTLGVLLVLISFSAGYGFTVSPTQVNHPAAPMKSVKVAPEVLDALLADKDLSAAVDFMVVSEDGRYLSSLRGTLSEPMKADPVSQAKSFVLRNHALFNLPSQKEGHLKVVRAEAAANGHHVSFQTHIDGVDIRHGLIEIHMDSQGRVCLANGSRPTISAIGNEIVLGRYEAIRRASELLGVKKARGVPQAYLEVFPSADETGRMVYVVRIPAEQPLGDWEILIDAENGAEVYRNNEMAFASRPDEIPENGNQGLGAVYVNHPLISSITHEILPYLTKHNLIGKYANIQNEAAPVAFNEQDQHLYPPEDTHFDEPQMYFYLNQIHSFFKKLGFDKLDKPVVAKVHYGTNYDNAFFSPWGNYFAFGDGSRFNSLSREESIAYHEYSHGQIAAIVSLTYSKESGAMNEGQADYFACSLSNDDKLGEWACAKMGKPYLRILENNLHYPEDIQGEVHADGKIWGAVLWDIRKAIGAETADMLIHKSFYYLKSGGPTFLDGYNALVTADQNVFGGANRDALEKIMQKRGIIAASYNGAAMTRKDIQRLKLFREVHAE